MSVADDSVVFGDLELLSLRRTADALGLTPVRVRQLLADDRLAGVLHGGRWLVAVEEIERIRAILPSLEQPSRSPTSRRFRPPPRPALHDRLTTSGNTP